MDDGNDTPSRLKKVFRIWSFRLVLDWPHGFPPSLVPTIGPKTFHRHTEEAHKPRNPWQKQSKSVENGPRTPNATPTIPRNLLDTHQIDARSLPTYSAEGFNRSNIIIVPIPQTASQAVPGRKFRQESAPEAVPGWNCLGGGSRPKFSAWNCLGGGLWPTSLKSFRND